MNQFTSCPLFCRGKKDSPLVWSFLPRIHDEFLLLFFAPDGLVLVGSIDLEISGFRRFMYP